MKTRNPILGALAGMAGGVAFGMLMGMMGMLPMVAQLVGSHSSVIGFLVHMINSALIGGAFGTLLGSKVRTPAQGAGWGAGYGVIWWFLGTLLIMPIWLGMPAQLHVEGMKNAMPSLMGHVIYGIITGITFDRLSHRSVSRHVGVLSTAR
ncbi:MAG: hypothetical protein AB1792_06355 [Candidatus Zixiibacteriota bacterium]